MSEQRRVEPVPRLLVVDDDGVLRRSVREALEPEGYEIHDADDGDAATRRFSEVRPDLVLLDAQPRGSSGFEVCKAIRELPSGQRVPIVMMAGRDDYVSIRLAYAAGATDFVTKPTSGPLLAHRVRNALRSKRTADALRLSERSLVRAQQLGRWGQYTWDLRSGALELSRSAAEILGLRSHAEARNLDNLLETTHPDDLAMSRVTIRGGLKRRAGYNFEHRVVTPGSEERVVRHEVEISADDFGESASLLGIVQDVTARRQAEERVRHLAYFDGVTGLPNRTLFTEMLRHSLASARRYDKVVAILFCDLDNFQQINDTLGHDVGDELLRGVAARLKECFRCTDLPEKPADLRFPWEPFPHRIPDSVSRFGGDEFAAVLNDVTSEEYCVKVVERVREKLGEPFSVRGRTVSVTASIGISAYPLDGDSIEALFRNADAAMHQAKRRAPNSYQFYTDAINERAVRRFALENDLRRALRDELELHYQPKLDLRTGKVFGVEALVRWHRSERGMVSPGEFIPVAEETGLIVPIGEWILTTACRQALAWQNDFAPDLSIAVNLSVRQLREARFVERLQQTVQDSGLTPGKLELELTESVFMDDADHCIALLESIRETGVGLALDDFGTGYSSLSYLRRLPLDTLKIDRSFVMQMEKGGTDVAIVGALILLAHRLGLKVVAEGIENRDQLNLLRERDCDGAQGFLFSKPLAADACEALLRRVADSDAMLSGAAQADDEKTSDAVRDAGEPSRAQPVG